MTLARKLDVIDWIMTVIPTDNMTKDNRASRRIEPLRNPRLNTWIFLIFIFFSRIDADIAALGIGRDNKTFFLKTYLEFEFINIASLAFVEEDKAKYKHNSKQQGKLV